MKLVVKGVYAKPQGIVKLDLDLANRGPSYWARKDEKWVFWLLLRDLKALRAPKRCLRTHRSMIRYP